MDAVQRGTLQATNFQDGGLQSTSDGSERLYSPPSPGILTIRKKRKVTLEDITLLNDRNHAAAFESCRKEELQMLG